MKALLRLPFVLLAALPVASQTPLSFELVADGLIDPVGIAAPPGDDRVFVVAHWGPIQVVENGVVLPTPYLDISAKVPPPPAGEAGFLDIAFHPNYAENGYVYVHYTDTNFDTVIERYTVSSTDPNVADPASATLIMFIPQTSAFHNGGGMRFGPAGLLHIGLGDGGGPSALGAECIAQDISSPLGKILRIDVDAGFPYAIPPSNPFVGVPGAMEEVFHYGLRNPWRFGIDAENGDLFIGDVGAMTWEEINHAPGGVGGQNFGWPLNEGNVCYPFSACAGTFPSCDDPSFAGPIYTQGHLTPPFSCAMVGGEVYRGCALPELSGRFFFTDYCNSVIQSFQYDSVLGVQDLRDHTPELGAFYPLSQFITSFATDGDGELIFLYQATPDFDGKVYRMIPATPPAGLVDCDRNGFDDDCEIAKDSLLDKDLDGVLDDCQGLSGDGFSISVSQGGQQLLQLHPGLSHAGKIYILAGSITGTAGIPLGPTVNVPLTFDAYTTFSLSHPDSLPLFDNVGVIHGAGEATANFRTIPGLIQISMVGTKAYHAYALLGGGAVADYASNFITLEFTP